MPAVRTQYMDDDGQWNLVSAGALASALGENPMTVDDWCQFRHVKAIQFSGQWYLPREEFERIVEANRPAGAGDSE